MNGLKTKAKINVCLNKLNEKHCRLVGMIFIFSMKFIIFGHFGINMVWIYPKSMSFLILCDINDKRLIISFSAHPLLYQLPAVSPITKSRFARYPVFGMKKEWFATGILYDFQSLWYEINTGSSGEWMVFNQMIYRMNGLQTKQAWKLRVSFTQRWNRLKAN